MNDEDDSELVDAIMGWDGEPCVCPICACPRFVDEPRETWCRE